MILIKPSYFGRHSWSEDPNPRRKVRWNSEVNGTPRVKRVLRSFQNFPIVFTNAPKVACRQNLSDPLNTAIPIIWMAWLIQSELDNICSWTTDNDMKLNCDKRKEIVALLSRSLFLKIDVKPVEHVQSYKCM